MSRVLYATLAIWASAPVAQAAEVRTDARCYREGADVQLNATGFSAGSVFAALLDGVRLGGGLVEQAGVLDAAGGAAATTFRVSRPSARVRPSPRDPRTARIRFEVFGMGAGRPEVRADWIDPDGVRRGTRVLGRASGPCGRLTTGRR